MLLLLSLLLGIGSRGSALATADGSPAKPKERNSHSDPSDSTGGDETWVENFDGFSQEQIAAVDIDGDGIVTGNEARFVEIDVDVNGMIDPDELMDFVIELLDDPEAPDITEDDVSDVLKLIDTDGDDAISFQEFIDSQHLGILPADELGKAASDEANFFTDTTYQWLSIDEVSDGHGGNGGKFTVVSVAVPLPFATSAVTHVNSKTAKHLIAILHIIPSSVSDGEGPWHDQHLRQIEREVRFERAAHQEMLLALEKVEELNAAAGSPDEKLEALEQARDEKLDALEGNYEKESEAYATEALAAYAASSDRAQFTASVASGAFLFEKTLGDIFRKVIKNCVEDDEAGGVCPSVLPPLPGRTSAAVWARHKAQMQAHYDRESAKMERELAKDHLENVAEGLPEGHRKVAKVSQSTFHLFFPTFVLFHLYL